MFWKLSSLQNVDETRVVPYCKGGWSHRHALARTNTRTHKRRCAQGSVEILVMRGEGPTSYNSSLPLISGLCCTEEYTQVCMIIHPLCHAYSEPSGHEESPGITKYMSYLLKN